MPDPATGVAADCVAVGVIRYHWGSDHTPTRTCLPEECPIGIMLYAKAVVSEHAAPDVRAFALSDPLFPGYSTADQFLGQVQFDRLVSLGGSTAWRAIEVHLRLRELGVLEGPPPDPAQLPAFAELARSALVPASPTPLLAPATPAPS